MIKKKPYETDGHCMLVKELNQVARWGDIY